MARTVRDARLETRTARLRLKPGHEPYWRSLDEGMHLGYRKGARKASWIGRYRLHSGRYTKKQLGIADDVQDADGVEILNYSQAQTKARDWFRRLTLEPVAGHVGPLTVEAVMNRYLDWFEHNRRGTQSVRYNVNAYILPELGDIEVDRLSARRIRNWHQSIAAQPVRLRTRRGAPQRYGPPAETEEEKRRRRVTANKVLSTLKAALNQAFADGDIAADEAWRRVKPFKNVEAPRIRYLDTDECRRLINACSPDFRLLVQAALLTGARYGELTRLRAGDVSPDAEAIHIRFSKSGRPRDVPLDEQGMAFFGRLVAGKLGGDLLFSRDDGGEWGKSHQRRRLEEACQQASISPPISFHILRHTYGSHLAMQGVPLPVIAAALGHSDTRITERHYSHLSPSYVADTIRSNLPKLALSEPERVVQIKGRAGDG